MESEKVKYAICSYIKEGTYHAFFMKNKNDVMYDFPICDNPDLENMTLEDWHNDWEIYKRDITGNETRDILTDLRNREKNVCGTCCSVIFGNDDYELEEIFEEDSN